MDYPKNLSEKDRYWLNIIQECRASGKSDYQWLQEHNIPSPTFYYHVKLYYGLKEPITNEEFAQRIQNNTLLEVLNKVQVKKGDVFFIEPGTIHAIGRGNLIAEIRQNSNVTYRVYDYGRVGADGKERELHIDKAKAVTKCIPPKRDYDFGTHLVSCDYFTVDKYTLSQTTVNKISGTVDSTSFASVLVLEGAGTIKAGEEVMQVKKGDSIFMEADTGYFEVEGNLELLFTTV